MMIVEAIYNLFLSFLPLKQMERMKMAISTYSRDDKMDLDNIQNSFKELLPWLGANYKYYTLLVPYLISLMEKRQTDAACCMFINAYQELQNKVVKKRLDKSDFVPSGSVKGGKDYFTDIGKPILTAVMQPKNVRLSDVVMPKGLSYSQEELSRVLSDVVIMIQEGMRMRMNSVIFEGVMGVLPLARVLSVELNCLHVFYQLVGLFLEHVAMYVDKQQARDITEEILICGEKDNQEHEAYLVACKVYLVCGNLTGALIFYNIHQLYLSQVVVVSNSLLYKSIWQFSKIARKLGFAKESFYDELEGYLKMLGVERQHILEFIHSKYMIFMSIKKPDLVANVLKTLDENHDYVINDGIHSAIPWWMLLAQMKTIYPTDETKALIPWLDAFDNAIPDKTVLGKYYNYIKGIHLKDTLKEEIAGLQNTRYEDDYSKDCGFAMSMAKRLITSAGKSNHIPEYLMAMLVRADYGFVFDNKPTPTEEPRELKWSRVEASDVALIHEDCDSFERALAHDIYDEVVWLGEGEDGIYQMSKDKCSYAITKLDGWDFVQLSKFVKERTTNNSFCRFIKDERGGSREVDPSEHQEKYETELIKCKDFPTYLIDSASRVLFVKDIDISSFPHQLIVEGNQRKFVGELKPSANILSSEFLMMENFADNLPADFTKSFWSPIDSETGKDDMALQMVYSYIEDELVRYAFHIESGLIPSSPLSSDINIVCAHGSSKIKDEPCLAINGSKVEKLNNLSKIIGKGRLLVLMVCHSGEMGTSIYDNSVHSLIKKYIRAGYSSIVAPMWALPIEIFNIWMPVFLDRIHKGDYIIDALFDANMAVKHAYADPSAWACMHMFGNPYLRQEHVCKA